MAERFVYSTGTISIATGASVVTGAGTAWGGRDRAGSCIYACPAGAGPVLVGVVAEADPRGAYDDLALPLVAPWNGATLTDAAYVLVDGAAIANGATQAAIYARFAVHLEQNMGLAGNDADDIDYSLVPNNSLIVDHETKHIKQWRNGVLEAVGNGVDGKDGATIFAQDDEPDTDLPAGSLWIDANSADLDIYQLIGSPPEWVPLGIALKGSPGADGVDGDDGVDGINGASALTVVRTVATANVSIASALEAGDAVSGVTLAANDLVLLTAQTDPAENGIYVVSASGAASRHASFATYDSHPGCYFSVCEGTGVADTLWRCTSDRGGTLGTTALAFSQFTAGGDVAGDTHAAAGKSTPVDADELPLVDSAASNVLKKLTWANLKATLAAWLVSAGWIREKLTADRTYYVATSGGGGSDSNDGLSSGTPFLTGQKAINVVAALDLSIYNVTIQFANGSYTGNINALPWVGSGTVTLRGDPTTPGNVSINGRIRSSRGTKININGLKMTATSGTQIYVDGGYIYTLNVEGAGGVDFMSVTEQGFGLIGGSWKISGNYSTVLSAGYNSQLTTWGTTLTLAGTPAWSIAFLYMTANGSMNGASMTFAGTGATGARYNISGNSVCMTAGGSSYFPGNSNGTTATGGQYL